jgi:cell division protein ZapA (FtsZ GTPase activity inhibitor)
MRIELLGTSFTIKTDQDEAYLKDLVAYLETKVREIESTVPARDPVKVAILAALLVVDELFQARLEPETETTSKHAEELAERLIQELDAALNSGE